MLVVVKTRNGELQNELIQENRDLKMVHEMQNHFKKLNTKSGESVKVNN